MPYRLSGEAEKQINSILLESGRRHGLEAAVRYERLLLAAMTDVGNDQFLVGSRQILGLGSVRTYSIGLSRRRLGLSDRVRKPRHLIVYRAGTGGTADIIAIVHNRMLLSRAARRAMRDAGYLQ